MDTIRRHQAVETGVEVRLEDAGNAYRIYATADAPISGGAFVTVVRYQPSATVDVLRGENAGRTLTYHNIVTDMQVLARWDGASPLSLRTAKGQHPIAVLIQRAESGPMLASAHAR